MTDTVYQLAETTYVEPLVNDWSAWWMSLSPLPASLHVLHYQLPTMRSYLAGPKMHFDAAKNPMFKGGPFINVPAVRANEIAQLLQRTEQLEGDRIELARAYQEFETLLLASAKGQALDDLYERMPAPLRGLVELGYDYHDRPLLRVFESAAYRSRYHKPQLQTLRMATLRSDARPFWLSTPRLAEPEQVSLQIPFDDRRVDDLFALDLQPRSLSAIQDVLGASHDGNLKSLLTDQPRSVAERWTGSRVRVRYIGHACVLLEANGSSVLVDPFVGAHRVAGRDDRFSFADLPASIDFALITHSHPDHFNFETLLRLRHRIKCLVVPRNVGIVIGDVSLKLLARRLGFQHVEEVDPYDSLALQRTPAGDTGEIVAVPFLGEHGDLIQGNKTGYMVRFGDQRIMLLADSACHDPTAYANVFEQFGAVDSVFIATGDATFPMDYSIKSLLPRTTPKKGAPVRTTRGANETDTLRVLEAVRARRVFNYGLGLEAYTEYVLGPPGGDASPELVEATQIAGKMRARGLQAEVLRGSKLFMLDDA